MAGGKQFEFLFQLTAKLGPNFSQTFKNASKTMDMLQSNLTSADKKLKDVSSYQKQQNAVAKSRDRVNELQAEHERLIQEIEQAGQATPELTRKLQANETAMQKAKDATSREEERLQELSETLREAGINTNNLGRDTEELRQEYERLERSQKKIQEISEKQKKNNEAISKTKGQIIGTIGGVTALAGSFFALDSATEEYRNNQAKVNTAFKAAGLSTDAAKQAYLGFYKVLGDDDTATEASQLLAKLTRNEKDVSKWTNIAAGIYGTFGDALPVEGLIESANETARVGQITGSLADAINWATKEGETFGVKLKENTKKNEEWNNAVKGCQSAEDYFNLALQACGTEAERNKLIMDTLQGTYQDAAKTFKENNKQIIQNRAAQAAWNDILGKTGKIAGTVKGMLLEMLGVSADGSIKANSALEKVQTTLGKIADNPELIKTIAKTVVGLAGIRVAGLTAKLGFLQVKGGILAVQKAMETMKAIGASKYLSTMTGGFGSVITKMLPLVGVIAAIGGAIYYVSTHLEQVRGFIQKTFGDEGLAIFDKLWSVIAQVGAAIKTAFFISGSGVLDTLQSVLPIIISTLQTGLLPLLPMIMNTFVQILPLLSQIVTAILPVLGELASAVITVLATLVAEILPVIVQLISVLLPMILQIIQSVLPVFIQLVNTIVPILMQIIQAVLPVIIQLIQTILPLISQIVQTILPVFISALNTIVPIFLNIIQTILPVLQQLLTALMPVIQMVAQVIANVFGTALSTVASLIGNLMQMFQGLIDFITGVFTGNWSQAWNGIKNIFRGAVGGLGDIIKAPLRAVVSAVNTVIGGLNKLKVPEWVPGLGGKGINIPLIPGFANGTNYTPDTFIAGEQGPELITGAVGRKVFTAAQTGQIFRNIENASNVNAVNNITAGTNGATITIHVTNAPNVTITNGSQNIKQQLEQYDQAFLEKLREIIVAILKEQKEQEERVIYA